MTDTNEKQEVEEANKEVSTTSTDANSNVGVSEEIDFVAEAKKVNEELKTNLTERKKLVEREEKLVARQEALKALGGGSQAGTGSIKKHEETPKEYADRIMKGQV